LEISFLLGLIFLALTLFGLLRQEEAQLAMCGVQTFAGGWVFFDALRHRIPRPLRWALGTMFLFAIIFPWYVARRRMPQSPVPFVEAEVGPVTRFLIFALLLFFLASLIFYIVRGPSPITGPTPAPKEHRSGGNSPARIDNLRPWEEGCRRTRPREGSRPLAGAQRTQAETSAPSDAWQT
jgi:hypothetical protein